MMSLAWPSHLHRTLVTLALYAVPPFLVLVTLAFFSPSFDLVAATRESWLPLVGAALLYGTSHLLRAVRLGLLSASPLHMHVRTLVLLHLYTAPVSFILPFKLGELFRWQQLAWLSGNSSGALVLILIERMLDAVVLLVVLAAVLIFGGSVPAGSPLLGAVLLSATLLGLFTILGAPRCLQELQVYMLRHHNARRARRALRFVDSLRRLTTDANARLAGNGAVLLLLSAFIWLAEGFMLVILAAKLGKDTGRALVSLLAINLSPKSAQQPYADVINMYVFVALGVLIVVWPMVAARYIGRTRYPIRLGPPPPTPLSSGKIRRIHLRSSVRIS